MFENLAEQASDDVQTVEAPAKRKWYTRWQTWALFVGVAGATATAAVVGVNYVSPHGGPAGQLAKDGYSSLVTLSHEQIVTAAGNNSDAKLAASMVTNAAYGVRGTKAEVVLGLTSSGKTLLDNPLMIAAMQGGTGGEQVHVDGDYLIIDGNSSQLNTNNLFN